MGGVVKYTTELYSYVSSFGLGMNEDFWNRLSPDLKKLVMDTTTGKEAEVGKAWDALDVPGKKALMDAGGEAIKLSAADTAKIRAVGAQVSETLIKGYEAKGMPARAVYDSMRSLSERHAKTSKNFWN
jgi:TRAP-type C4-dicarboxylate transport system substrate-binding protein